MLTLNKFTAIITTRCNLKCKLCCEYVPQNKPFPDMKPDELKRFLDALFDTVDSVATLHLSGGGEPFLHPQLAELTEIAFVYEKQFDRFMLFTNCTVKPKQDLLDTLRKYGERVIVQCSRYGINPEREVEVIKILENTGCKLKIEKYYGDDQSFGGWVDFGNWEKRNRTPNELESVFANCAVTRDMCGNWRGRDGKVHWCSRSQRGLELKQIPDFPQDYVDLYDGGTRDEHREQFERIMHCKYLQACDYCSGEQGTLDMSKRHQAAEQLEELEYVK